MNKLLVLTLASLVSLSLSAESTKSKTSQLEKAFETIDSLSENLRADQLKQDLNFQSQLKQCQEEIKYRERELSDSKYSYKRAVVEHDICEHELQYSNIKKEFIERFEGFVKGKIPKFRGIQSLEQSFSGKRIEIYDSLLESVDKVLSFDSKSELLELGKTVMASGNSGLMSDFLQLSSSSADKFAENLASIKTSVKNARKERVFIEDDIDHRYKSIFAVLKNLVDSFADSNERFNEYITSMKECIKQQESMEFSASDQLLRSQNLLRNIGILCKDWADQYKAITTSREKQGSLLATLKSITSKRFK